MSTPTATVTAGYTFVADGSGNILITKARLNSLGIPAVTVSLTGVILEEDFQDNVVPLRAMRAESVGEANLTNSARAYLRTLTVTASNDHDGSGQVQIQVKDASAVALADRFVVEAWVATSQWGAPGSIGTFAPTTGTTIQSVSANAHLRILTDATGAIVLNVNPGSGGTWYVMVMVDGKVFAVQVLITTT